MKKKVVLIILAFIGFISLITPADGAGHEEVRVLDTREIMSPTEVWEQIEARNGDLIIVKTYGEAYDSQGNGESGLGYTKYSVEPGVEVTSYFIYNPETNAWDDTIARFDYVGGELIYASH